MFGWLSGSARRPPAVVLDEDPDADPPVDDRDWEAWTAARLKETERWLEESGWREPNAQSRLR
jgi:hypothetical protein